MQHNSKITLRSRVNVCRNGTFLKIVTNTVTVEFKEKLISPQASEVFDKFSVSHTIFKIPQLTKH